MCWQSDGWQSDAVSRVAGRARHRCCPRGASLLACWPRVRAAQWARGVAGGGLFLLLFLPVATFTLGMAARVEPEVQAAVASKYQSIRQGIEVERKSASGEDRVTRWTPDDEQSARAGAAEVAFP